MVQGRVVPAAAAVRSVRHSGEPAVMRPSGSSITKRQREQHAGAQHHVRDAPVVRLAAAPASAAACTSIPAPIAA